MNPYSWHSAYAETADATYSVQRERQLKKKKLWTDRYNQYKVYYYGSREDKESKNCQLRNVLKEQIEEIKNPNKAFVATVEESQRAAKSDRTWEVQNQEQQQQRKCALIKFRDDNKKLIELKAQNRKEVKEAQSRLERHVLAQNPINWNQSLS